jgi:hypothetical protein
MLYIAPLVVFAARVQKELHRDLENPATKHLRQLFIFNIKPEAKYALTSKPLPPQIYQCNWLSHFPSSVSWRKKYTG